MEGLTPVVNLFSGCDYHRITLPLRYLGVDVKNFINADPDKTLKDTKALIFNRNPDCGIEPFEYYRNKYGFKLICDVDDYWELYPNHILYKSWKVHKVSEKIVYNIKISDVVLTTTARLADKIKPLNKNVHVVPNGLPFGKGQFTDRRTASDRFRVLYAGGSSHLWDLRSIRHLFTKLVNESKVKNCQFILAGYNNGGVWDDMEKVFTAYGKLKNYLRRDSLELEDYMGHYEHADLSIAPLESNHFNAFKSNLKIIEAGCKNIPIIASNCPPYCDDILLNKRIFLANNTGEWYKFIKELANNPEQVKDMGEALGEYVRQKYDLLKINKIRKQIIEHIIR